MKKYWEKKHKKSLRGQCKNTRKSNFHVIGVPEGEEKNKNGDQK